MNLPDPPNLKIESFYRIDIMADSYTATCGFGKALFYTSWIAEPELPIDLARLLIKPLSKRFWRHLGAA